MAELLNKIIYRPCCIIKAIDSYFIKKDADPDTRYRTRVMLYLQIIYLIASNFLYIPNHTMPVVRHIYLISTTVIRLVLIKKDMKKSLISLTMLDWLLLPFFLLWADEEYTIRSLAGFLVVPYVVHLFYVPRVFSTLIAIENLMVIGLFKTSIRDIFEKKDKEFVIQAIELYTKGVIIYVVTI
jgi:hypothetical protein